MDDNTARVLLTSMEWSEPGLVESECDANWMREAGIQVDDEFTCDVDDIGMTVTRLPPKTLSKEEVKAIVAKFANRWNF